MVSRKNRITSFMWKEVALKSTPATLAFSTFAVLTYFYQFGLTTNKEVIKAASLVIIVANLMRLWLSKKIDPEFYDTDKFRQLLRSSIWLNALGWGLTFGAVTVETQGVGVHFTVMLSFMLGFTTASLITLAYDKSLYFPFQILLVFPVIGGCTYLYFENKNTDALILTVIFLFYFVYQVSQYKAYRLQLIQRFNDQIDLEVTNEELKQKQAALVEQTSKLIHASRISALGEMAGGLAHEVNNSLMVILGSTQQLERQLRKKNILDDGLSAKIAQATHSIMKIKTVVEGLRNFSLQMEPTPKEATDLTELIHRTLNYCQELLNAHGVDVRIDPIPEVLIKVQPFQIIQILFNLAKNADDALMGIPQQDRWIQFSFETDKKFVQIKIKNSGPMILTQNIDRLFQPFFTTKDVGQGTGLSLSTSKGFAREHGGDLYFDGSEKVTTFVLKLPLA